MLYLILPAMVFFALAILWLALPHARDFRRPERFRRGVFLIAAGTAILGTLPLALYWTVDDWHLRNLLLLVVLIVPFGMIGFGLHKITRADIAPRDDLWF